MTREDPDGMTLTLPRSAVEDGEGPVRDACVINLHPPGPDIGRRIELTDTQYVVGRERDAGLPVVRESVSRKHARLFLDDDGGWWVEDLNSTNGTFVNEARIRRERLADGDQVRFGDAIYKFLSGSNVESAYHEAILNMAVQDGMTGLHNKRFLLEFLEREIAIANRHGHPLTLVLLDVDHFKMINDTHGHLAGDAVLKELAQRLRKRVRREDLVARYGGEEFACVLPLTPLTGGITFAEHVRTLIEEKACQHEATAIRFTVSLGVTTLHHERGVDPSTLIKRADENLYAAKRGGRNRVVPKLEDVGHR